MVRLLIVDVSLYGRHIRLTDGEGTIAGLPEKGGELLPLPLDPFGGSFLDLFHDFLQGMVFRKTKENVDMVSDRVYLDSRAMALAQNASKVGMQVRANGNGQDGLAVLGAENQVEDVFDEGLRHARGPFSCALSGLLGLGSVSQGVTLGWILAALQAEGQGFLPGIAPR
jgi:hypothetical protein